jgi:hypothetical protein
MNDPKSKIGDNCAEAISAPSQPRSDQQQEQALLVPPRCIEDRMFAHYRVARSQFGPTKEASAKAQEHWQTAPSYDSDSLLRSGDFLDEWWARKAAGATGQELSSFRFESVQQGARRYRWPTLARLEELFRQAQVKEAKLTVFLLRGQKRLDAEAIRLLRAAEALLAEESNLGFSDYSDS